MFGILRPNSPEQNDVAAVSLLSSPPPRSLAPMPDADFANREDMLAGTKAWAAGQAFAVVIARSRFNRLWLKCDRGGSYENRRQLAPDQRKRKRGESRLLGCPFKMLCTIKKDGTWHVMTQNPEHNHGPSEDLSQHPTLRKMTEEQLRKVHEMLDNGNSPSETIEELRRLWPQINVLTRDIYNARKKHKSRKEGAEAAAGVPAPQVFPDPNGIIPGPDERGKWAWVPDGEEVTNKNGKRRRKTAPPAPTSLDPQLQTPSRSILPDPSMSSSDQQLLVEFQNSIQSSSYSQPQYSRSNTSSTNATGYVPSPLYNGGAFNQSPSHLRSQVTPNPSNISPTNPRTDQSMDTRTDAPPKVPSGQVLMSRIERMEEEQKDQKNMLAQILGAVQGMSGSPIMN